MAAPAQTEAPRVILSDDYSIKLLVIATIRQAMWDAVRGDLKAFMWLESEGLAWFDACGLNCSLLVNWLKNPTEPRETKQHRTPQDERKAPKPYRTNPQPQPRAEPVRVLICSYA